MKDFENLLRQADFSKETDLKQRLHARLFQTNVVKFPGSRVAVDDDMLSWVNAAGTVPPKQPDDKDPIL